ncbi:MAG: thioredoxin family protein [Rhodobacteraceae bacterium]|nr:thioredoxin family protein [Paracoccaceae bacterium]
MLRSILLAAALVFTPLLVSAEEVPLGDDGLHKPEWLNDTFLDMREDLADAQAQGKRLAIIVEQRGCIYCDQMHNEIFPIPEINGILNDEFYFVQINMFGDLEITDFDGEVLSERNMIKKWGVFFTPTILFIDDEITDSADASEAIVAVMPGAFGKFMTLNMLNWVLLEGYNTDEHFQKYHARMLETQLDR